MRKLYLIIAMLISTFCWAGNTVQTDHGASLLAWTYASNAEHHIYVRFDAAMLARTKRAFTAFNIAYASGITEVTFDGPVALTIDGVPYTGTMHIGVTGLYPPALWLELRTPDLIFSDSLTYTEVFD